MIIKYIFCIGFLKKYLKKIKENRNKSDIFNSLNAKFHFKLSKKSNEQVKLKSVDLQVPEYKELPCIFCPVEEDRRKRFPW